MENAVVKTSIQNQLLTSENIILNAIDKKVNNFNINKLN